MDKIGFRYLQAFNEKKEHISSRYNELIKSAEILENNLKDTFGENNLDLHLSNERLQLALENYFYDIYRYKDFHGMHDNNKESLVNFPKIFSFTTKWILKEKPFYLDLHHLDPTTSDMDKKDINQLLIVSSYINELFLVGWFEESYETHFKKELDVSQEDISNMLYNFKFRELSVPYLQLFFETKIDNKEFSLY